MNIKQKIWAIPLVTIFIFVIGISITYKFTSDTYNLLLRTDKTYYPYLENIQTLYIDLTAIQENLIDAIDSNGSVGIAQARKKADDFRTISQRIAALDGKADISRKLLEQFNSYYVPAESAASIMIGIKAGEVTSDFDRMLPALNQLNSTLQQERDTAEKSFAAGLENSRANLQKMLWVNFLSALLVVIGLALVSARLIASILSNLEKLREGANRIALGNFSERIPEQGQDELTVVIQTFNSMGGELQNAIEKRAQYEKQLETLNRDLEDRVVTRTSQLNAALEEANKANAAVAHLANHDTLTGLLNRRRFQEELDRWGKYALRYNRPITLMFIDLDKFKQINDTYGHLGGDEYLMAFTHMLKSTLRTTDYIGRWGGDEFAVLLPETDTAAACEVATKLPKIFNTVPITVAGKTVYASASIGIAVLPEHTADINELTAFADAAMYKAKEAGRGCFCVYSASEQEIKHLGEQAHWAGRIRRALETDQFILLYQPLLHLKTGETPEYEALLRMEDVEGRYISPASFLESAERYDLSVSIDRMVIRKTAHKIASHKNRMPPLRLSLNLSSQSLNDANMVQYIRDALNEFAIDPADLAIEISESAILQNINRGRNLCSEISQLGCRLILDDIGVGFSSFNYLAPLTVHSIKIRNDLTNNLHHPSTLDFITGLCTKAHELNIEVVAKLVEDSSLIGTLRDIGVDYAQGFAVGRPMESLDILIEN